MMIDDGSGWLLDDENDYNDDNDNNNDNGLFLLSEQLRSKSLSEQCYLSKRIY